MVEPASGRDGGLVSEDDGDMTYETWRILQRFGYAITSLSSLRASLRKRFPLLDPLQVGEHKRIHSCLIFA